MQKAPVTLLRPWKWGKQKQREIHTELVKWKPETSPNPFGLQADVRNTNHPHAGFALRHDQANSRAIGYSATQQNTAFDAAVRAPELYPGNGPEAYRLRVWIHDNLGNHEEAERERRLDS